MDFCRRQNLGLSLELDFDARNQKEKHLMALVYSSSNKIQQLYCMYVCKLFNKLYVQYIHCGFFF